MATVNTFTETPNPVPSGQVGTITLTFTLAPGTPAQTANISIYDNGTLVNSATGIVLNGTPGEAVPAVGLNTSTNSGWEIRTTAGVLALVGSITNGYQYSIAHS